MVGDLTKNYYDGEFIGAIKTYHNISPVEGMILGRAQLKLYRSKS